MAGTLAETHAVSSAGWPGGRHASVRIVDAAPVPPSWSVSALARMGPPAVQCAAQPVTGPPHSLGRDRRGDAADDGLGSPYSIPLESLQPRRARSAGPVDKLREEQMIRIVHRILDIAAAAGSVAVTAHPAAALAHLGQPRAPRPTRRARRRRTPTQPAPAPERLTWVEWARDAGSQPASSGDGTLRPEESRVPQVRGMSSSQTHPVR